MYAQTFREEDWRRHFQDNGSHVRKMQKSVTAKMRRRIVGILIGFLVIGFTAVIVKLFQIQILEGEWYQEGAAQQQTRATTIGATRGTIYDRNQDVLAKSGSVWNVCISPADIDSKKIAEHAQNLAEIIGVTPEHIVEQATDRTKYYKIIKRQVNQEVRDAVLTYITENEMKGVMFELDTKRYYPHNNLASTVLGFTNFENQGAYGLEAYYNKVLSGTPGVIVSAKNAWGSDMQVKYQQKNDAQPGKDIVLTIDQGIQHFLERHLERAIVEHSIGNRASGIIMDIKTGEILAMATKEDFNPNDPYTLQSAAAVAALEQFEAENKSILKPEEYETQYTAMRDALRYDQWRNKAISDPYEPGSVFKILTAATGLDTNVVSPNDQFFCTGALNVSNRVIHCHKLAGHGAQTFTEGMQNSCNPVFMMVGQRIGAENMFHYMDSFGLREATGIDLPGEAEAIRHSLETLSKEGMVELSSTSFGQTFKVTPLQMITSVCAAVNGGNLMQPYIVKQIRDHEGNVIQTTQPTIRRQVISAETSETMRTLVERVVDSGSGRNAAIPGYRIGGKTGTSEKIDRIGNKKHILSFVGFAPMEDPQYACLVLLDEPILDNLYGSVIAAPVVGAIFQEVLPYVGIEPAFTEEELAEKEVEVPYLIGQRPHDAQSELTVLGLQTRIVGEGPVVVQQIPQSGKAIQKGLSVTLYTDDLVSDGRITVPNVLGMTAQEANQAIVNDTHLNIQVEGVTEDGVPTVVSEQWPEPGEEAKTGDVVTITLIEKAPETE